MSDRVLVVEDDDTVEALLRRRTSERCPVAVMEIAANEGVRAAA